MAVGQFSACHVAQTAEARGPRLRAHQKQQSKPRHMLSGTLDGIIAGYSGTQVTAMSISADLDLREKYLILDSLLVQGFRLTPKHQAQLTVRAG